MHMGQLMRLSSRSVVAAVLVALAGITMTWTIAQRDRSLSLETARNRFQAEITQTITVVEDALDTYVVVARASEALLRSDPDMSQEDYESTMARIVAGTHGKAIAAANYVVLLDAAEAQETIAARQEVSSIPFSLFPETGADVVAPVWLLFPRGTNLPALGFDILSNDITRAAARASQIANTPMLTDALTVLQENEDQNWIILYNPVWTPAGPFQGWTNVMLRGQQFLDNLIGPSNVVAFRIVDDTPLGEKLVGQLPNDHAFDLDPPLAETRTIDLYGQSWTLDFEPRPALLRSTEDHRETIFAVGGLISLLLAALAFQTLRSRDSAVRLVAQRTVDLETTNARLREAAAAKDEFVAVVSHELRTPLTIIRGAFDTVGGAISDRQAYDIFRRAARNAHRLETLVDDLLTVAQFEDGSLDTNPCNIPVAAAVASVAKDLEMEVVVSILDDVTAFADPAQLERVFVNLLANAAKYGAPPYEVSAQIVGDRVKIEVIDHGRGVPDSTVPALFDRFRQGDSGITRRSQGVGLGLHIVKRLLEANGGSIHYEGGTAGARFVIDLPAGARALEPITSDDGRVMR